MVASAPQFSDEEAIKKNTDCVYFLASPLTCKKGSECEYRHSDVARLNPRDCWYWLHSNCLTPKCAFRHPPLDGLLGTQNPASTVSSGPMPKPVNSSSNPGGVPCVFFQKGHCFKGEWCQFLHVPSSSSSKVLAVPGMASVTKISTVKPDSSKPQKHVSEKKVVPSVAAKPVNKILPIKVASDAEPAVNNEFAATSRSLPSSMNDFSGYRSSHLFSDGNPGRLSADVQKHYLLDDPEGMNSKDLEDVSREPSPGFDVLVDNEGRDSDYYAGEDRYGISREHESLPTDYSIVDNIDEERYQDSMGYDPYEPHKGMPFRDQDRTLTKRMSSASHYETRSYNRPGTYAQIDESDLRHRLTKQKKSNGLRSVISHVNEFLDGEQSYQGPQWDERHASMHDNPVGTRLRGRIRLPTKSPSPGDKRLSSGTDHVGISPPRTRISRAKMRSQNDEPFTSVERNNSPFHVRSNASLLNGESYFSGPKSLSELKSRQNMAPIRHSVPYQHGLGKRKSVNFDGIQQGGSDPLFEGPKSLQEILKRKRGEANGIPSDTISTNNEDRIKDKNDEDLKDTETKVDPEDTQIPLVNESGKLEPEDEKHTEEGLDIESKAYEHMDGEEEYEYGEEGGEDLYEAENRDVTQEEYDDDDEEDDDDDFAKKMGIMHS